MPILEALRELGGSGTAQEVIERIAAKLKVSEQEQQEKTSTGVPRFANKVHWARQYLVWGALLESPQRGVWSLTDRGWKISFSPDEAVQFFKDVHKVKKSKVVDSTEGTVADEAPQESEADGYKEAVLRALRSLPPKGFENFSKRLLREYGFQRVEVTGGPKDKGIDGHGILKVNPFVSFRVVFQCKRYANTVTSREISEFRGSVPANADKALLITTGYFTSDATKLAQEPSRFPIELVDGDQIVALLEERQLGLKATYDIDDEFFNEFRDE